MCDNTGTVNANDIPQRNRVTGGILRISCVKDMIEKTTGVDELVRKNNDRCESGQRCRPFAGVDSYRSRTLTRVRASLASDVTGFLGKYIDILGKLTYESKDMMMGQYLFHNTM